MLYNKDLIQKAVHHLQSVGIQKVDIAVVLGSGLSHLAEKCENFITVPYDQMPGMSNSSVKGHSSKLIYTQIGGKNVAFLQGRMHMYEGFSAFQSAFPIAVTAELGAKTAILTNAAGGLNPEFNPGDIMMIEDHIKTQFASPLEGIHGNERFVDMQGAYDIKLYPYLQENFGIKKGIYVSTLGPQYETPAEVRYFHQIGGQAVGMSTVMETIMARFYGMRVLAFSMITNKAAGIPGALLQHGDVIYQAEKAGKVLGNIISYLISSDAS